MERFKSYGNLFTARLNSKEVFRFQNVILLKKTVCMFTCMYNDNGLFTLPSYHYCVLAFRCIKTVSQV